MDTKVLGNRIKDSEICNKKPVYNKGRNDIILIFTMLFVLFERFFETIIGFSSLWGFVIDIMLFYMLMELIEFVQHHYIVSRKYFFIAIPAIVLCLSVIFSFLVNSESLFNLYWGIRSFLRYFILFLFVSLKCNRIDVLKNYVYLFAFLQFSFVLFQKFILKMHQDSCGGFFGIDNDGSGSQNTFIILFLIYVIYDYNSHRISLVVLAAIISLVIIVSVITELKIAFLEIPLILIYAILRKTGFKFRYILYFAAALIVSKIVLSWFLNLYPQWVNFFSIDGLKLYLTDNKVPGYEYINRGNAFSSTYNLFLKRDVTRLLIGIGLGNGDRSSIGLFDQSFYDRFGHFHYTWITSSWVLLECGIIGLFSYLTFLFAMFKAFFSMKDKNLGLMGEMTIVLMVITFFYNQGLRVTQTGMMCFFMLAVPFLIQRKRRMVECSYFR